MNLASKLKLLRTERGLSQKDVARICGVGEKTISSFETGKRIGAMKLSQLDAILEACGMTLASFIAWDPEAATDAPPADAPSVRFEATCAQRPLTVAQLQPRDPLRPYRNERSEYPTPQSSLGPRQA